MVPPVVCAIKFSHLLWNFLLLAACRKL